MSVPTTYFNGNTTTGRSRLIKLAPPVPNTFVASLRYVEEYPISSGGTSEVTERDAIFTVSNPGQIGKIYEVDIQLPEGSAAPSVSVVPGTAASLVAGSSSRIRTTGNGQESVVVSNGSKTVTLQLSASVRTTGVAAKTFKDYTPTSLAGRINHGLLAAMLASSPPSLAKYVGGAWNTSNWFQKTAGGLGFIPYNTDTTAQRTYGCIVSPRHMLFAKHAFPRVGSKIRYAGDDGVVRENTLIDVEHIPSTDITMGLVDSAFINVAIAVLAPADLLGYLPNSGLKSIGCVGDNQFNELTYQSFYGINTSGNVNLSVPSSPTEQAFYRLPVSGDSGHPVILPLPDGQRVLLFTYWYPRAGPFTGRYLAEISNSVLALNNRNSGGGTIIDMPAVADMSAYTKYL